VPGLPADIEGISIQIGEPNLPHLTQECVALQLGVSPNEIVLSNSKTSVFHSAMATFFAPSDPSGAHGIRRECIHSTPSWRGCGPWHNCAFVIEDDTKPGMLGMMVVQVHLFFHSHMMG
jgi:hypothetical protein